MLTENWESNKNRINQLWPDVNWSPAEKELWHEELSTRNQKWLMEAIKAVAKNYSSDRPKLKWIVTAFDKIKRENEADEAARQARTQIEEKQISDREAEEMLERANKEMLGVLVALPPERLRQLAKKVREVLGLQVDVTQPPQTWSRTAVGCMVAAHKKLGTN